MIERPCKDVPAAKAAEVILGYTIANDVSARINRRRTVSGRVPRATTPSVRSGRGSRPQLDPAELDLRTEVNGEVRQHSNTALLLHDVGAIIEWVSAVMTLLPGDLILTGTPEGVGPDRRR